MRACCARSRKRASRSTCWRATARAPPTPRWARSTARRARGRPTACGWAPAAAEFYCGRPPVRTLSRLVALLAALLLLPLLARGRHGARRLSARFRARHRSAPGTGTAIVAALSRRAAARVRAGHGAGDRAAARRDRDRGRGRCAADAWPTRAALARAAAHQRGRAVVERAGRAGGRRRRIHALADARALAAAEGRCAPLATPTPTRSARATRRCWPRAWGSPASGS